MSFPPAREGLFGELEVADPELALAQLAATGTLDLRRPGLTPTLDQARALADQVHPGFLARCAIYSRERGYMKDLPALLCALLSQVELDLLEQVFPRVIDTGPLLRRYVGLLRSGLVGRRSLGTRSKRLIQRWFDARSDRALFRAAIGQKPSLADVIRLAHVHPRNSTRRALFAYLLGREHDRLALPAVVQHFEAFKRDPSGPVPHVDLRRFTSLPLTREQWATVACRARWQELRTNLCQFARRGVFEVPHVDRLVAGTLADPDELRAGRALPGECLAAYRSACANHLPRRVLEALQDGLAASLSHVPAIRGSVVVLLDSSAALCAPHTGTRAPRGSRVSTRDLSTLFAAALFSQGHQTQVRLLSGEAIAINPRDSLPAQAAILAACLRGAESQEAPRDLAGGLLELVEQGARWELVVALVGRQALERPELLTVWDSYRELRARRGGVARLACVQFEATPPPSFPARADLLQVGGLNDSAFSLLAEFARGEMGGGHWVRVVERVTVGGLG